MSEPLPIVSLPGQASPLRAMLFTALLVAASSLLFLVLPFPSHTQFWSALHNAGHSLLFTLLTLAACCLQDYRWHAGGSRLPWHRAWPLTHYLWAGSLLTGFGVAIELVQGTIGRDSSLGDVLLDVAGVVSGILIHMALSSGLQRRYRTLLMCIALGILVSCFQLPIRYGILNLSKPGWPVLANFDHHLAIDTVAAGKNTALRVIEAPAEWHGHGSSVLQIRFEPGLYPGMRLIDPLRDWSRAADLSLKIYNPGTQPVEITLRVHDEWHDHQSADRFNTRINLLPGANSITIGVDRIAQMSATASRRMDLENIDGLALFIHQNTSQVLLYLDDVKLE